MSALDEFTFEDLLSHEDIYEQTVHSTLQKLLDEEGLIFAARLASIILTPTEVDFQHIALNRLAASSNDDIQRQAVRVMTEFLARDNYDFQLTAIAAGGLLKPTVRKEFLPLVVQFEQSTDNDRLRKAAKAYIRES